MAKNIAASRQKKPSGLSDKVSDIVLVVICAAIMLIVAYPLYYVLVASFSDPYDVYAGKTFLLPSQFQLYTQRQVSGYHYRSCRWFQ